MFFSHVRYMHLSCTLLYFNCIQTPVMLACSNIQGACCRDAFYSMEKEFAEREPYMLRLPGQALWL